MESTKSGEEEFELDGLHSVNAEPSSGFIRKDGKTEPIEGLDSAPLIREVYWNDNRIHLYELDYERIPMVRYQVAFCLVMFVVFGFNDQITGSLLPTLIEDYHVSQVVVSSIFLIQLSGYTCASLLNERVHRLGGIKGAMMMVCVLCMVPLLILALRPPNFAIYAICCFPMGLGLGIMDAAANVLMGNLKTHNNEWMGILHALYGAAAMVTPTTVSYFVKWGHWSYFFFIPLTCATTSLILIFPAFKFETKAKYNYLSTLDHDGNESNSDVDETHLFQILKNPVVALYSLYMFLYLGAEITTGSWFFTYLLKTKSDNRISMSYVAASFWAGITMGRLCLGFVTKRLFSNEYKASNAYSWVALVFYSLFVAIGLLQYQSTFYYMCIWISVFFGGFFIGPLFPNASIVALQNLPPKLHISGMGTAVAIGGCGGAALPYISGIIIHNVGEGIIPTLCWSMVVAFTIVWYLYPRFIPALR
ncbi:Bypass of stop codon protein 6 [Nakaseomyces bracarensis]|uniref:Bypass of stop codon protein 6 n=1 Tax=Nakaseomyces bracarensis TaxID=273131 RepID=A0ABR4NT45_9SACH